MARPRIVIDPAEVEKLASFGCPNEEIGALLGCSENTIRRRFGEQTAKGRAALKKSLRRKQVEVALSGNATMLIWTGKNLLGQSDKQEIGGAVKHTGEITFRVIRDDGIQDHITNST